MGIIGPSCDLSVDNIRMNPGDKDVAGGRAGRHQAELYQFPLRAAHHFESRVSDDQADYAFTIAGVSDQPGSTINLAIPAEGGSLTMDNVGSAGTSTVSLKMTRDTEAGTQVFRHDAISLVGGDTAALQFGNWTNPSQGIPLVTTHNGQQSTQTLSDATG